MKRLRWIDSATAACLVCLLPAALGFGKDIVLRQDGAGDAKKLWNAVRMVSPGQTVVITDGATYVDSGVKMLRQAGVTLRSRGRRPVVTHKSGRHLRGTLLGNVAGWTIDGITFAGANIQLAAVSKDTAATTIRNCSFRSTYNCIQLYHKKDIKIENCSFSNAKYAVKVCFPPREADRPCQIILRNCVFWNVDKALQISDVAKNCTVVAEGCIFARCETVFEHTISYGLATDRASYYSDFNCFHQIGTAVYRQKGSADSGVDTTLSFSQWQGQGRGDEHSLARDPLLADPQAGDLRLAKRSPCVGVGVRGGNVGLSAAPTVVAVAKRSSQPVPVVPKKAPPRVKPKPPPSVAKKPERKVTPPPRRETAQPKPAAAVKKPAFPEIPTVPASTPPAPPPILVNGKDGSSMILVEAGEFTFGYARGAPNELPQQRIYLAAYYIDRLEITNAQYAKFLEHVRRKSDHSKCCKGEPPNKDHTPRFWNDPKYNKPDLPVVGIDWFDAYAYAVWAGKRLPTEAEWEKAARGTDGRLYPWGNVWDPSKGNFRGDGDGFAALAPVGRVAAGKSPSGCLEMAGNAMEWTNSKYVDYPYIEDDGREDPTGDDPRILRGGAWNLPGENWGRCSFRYRRRRGDAFQFTGFRCARDVD